RVLLREARLPEALGSRGERADHRGGGARRFECDFGFRQRRAEACRLVGSHTVDRKSGWVVSRACWAWREYRSSTLRGNLAEEHMSVRRGGPRRKPPCVLGLQI